MNIDDSNVIKADFGFILHNGDGVYAYEVTVPEGVMWEQVEDVGQMNICIVDAQAEEIK